MNETLERRETRMPKKESKKDRSSIKIDKELVLKLDIIKNATGEDMSDYLCRIAEPIIQRDWKKAMETIRKRDCGEDCDGD